MYNMRQVKQYKLSDIRIGMICQLCRKPCAIADLHHIFGRAGDPAFVNSFEATAIVCRQCNITIADHHYCRRWLSVINLRLYDCEALYESEGIMNRNDALLAAANFADGPEVSETELANAIAFILRTLDVYELVSNRDYRFLKNERPEYEAKMTAAVFTGETALKKQAAEVEKHPFWFKDVAIILAAKEIMNG